MTIRDAINRGEISINSINSLKKLCEQFNLVKNASGMSDEVFLNQDVDINKIKYSIANHTSNIYSSISETKSNLENKKDELSSFKDEVADFKRQIADINNNRGSLGLEENDNIKKDIQKIDDVLASIDKIKTNDFESRELGDTLLSRKIEAKEDKLKQKYEELDRLKSVNWHSKFKQRRNSKKISKMEDRIASLQQKQGKLQARQQKIINKNLDAYVTKKQNEINKFRIEYQREKIRIDKRINLMQTQNNLASDLKQNEKLLGELDNKKGLSAEIKKASIKMENASMKARIAALNAKEGIAKFSSLDTQICANRRTVSLA